MEPNVKAELKIVCGHNGSGRSVRIGIAKRMRWGNGWSIEIRENKRRRAAIRAAWDPSDSEKVFLAKYRQELKRRGLALPPHARESFFNYTDDEGNVYAQHGDGRNARYRLTCEFPLGGCGLNVEFREINIREFLDGEATRGSTSVDLWAIDARLNSNRTE